MIRLSCLLLLLACAAPARAHFVWLLPADSAARPLSARVIFSDSLEPDRATLLKKLTHLSVYARDAAGKVTELKTTAAGKALTATVPGTGPRAVLAVCPYGVVARGKAEPFLLHYSAKTFVGPDPADALLTRTWKRAALEVVPVVAGTPAVRVLWRGKPLAGAEVVLLVPGKDKAVERKTDKSGLVKLEKPARGGLYGVRAGHIVKKAGEQAGKKYSSVRYYATLTFPAVGGRPAALLAEGAKEGKRPADPEATKLLAEARAARATWKDFPGFTADLEVNVEGRLSKGTVEVSARGEVTVKLMGEAKGWARRTLESTVAHRLDSGPPRRTPCAFADDVRDHPLGRLIGVLNDEYHSSYRIRARQVIVVNRRARDVRFTITVLANLVNAEKRYLPTSFVVDTWDLKSDTLRSSAAHHQTWQRVGAFDLPRSTLTVTATGSKLEARRLKLANFRLKKRD
jgi:uncharacterized GH25 family protein